MTILLLLAVLLLLSLLGPLRLPALHLQQV